jgi:hypothetical protein
MSNITFVFNHPIQVNGSNITFVFNHPIQVNGSNITFVFNHPIRVNASREALMLQARGPFPLLSMVN